MKIDTYFNGYDSRGKYYHILNNIFVVFSFGLWSTYTQVPWTSTGSRVPLMYYVIQSFVLESASERFQLLKYRDSSLIHIVWKPKIEILNIYKEVIILLMRHLLFKVANYYDNFNLG